jgi:hypothetical protein
VHGFTADLATQEISMNRWLGTLFMGVTISAFGLAGCGDDSGEEDGEDGGQQTEATVNETATAAVVAASTRSLASLQTGDGYGAAIAMASVGSSAFGMLTYGGGSQAQSLDVGTAASAACEGADQLCTGDETSGSCNFTSCTDAGYSIEGTVSWTASSLDCDLTFTIDASATGATTTGMFHILCDIDYTSTSIDGNISTDGESHTEAQGQTVDVTYDTSVDYNQVVFPEGGGCPTSGSVDVSASITANGQGYSGEGTVTFPIAGCQ